MKELKLLGAHYTHVHAERKQNASSEDKSIKTNINIATLERSKGKDNVAELSYVFEASYGGGSLGRVLVEGKIFLAGAKEAIDEILALFSQKKLTSQEYVAITNLILQKASVKAFELEETVGLPLHLRLPQVNLSAKKA